MKILVGIDPSIAGEDTPNVYVYWFYSYTYISH